MRFAFSLAALAAMAASTIAQTADFDPIYSPTKGQAVPAGSVHTIEWDTSAKYANEKITILLLGGSSPETLEEEPTPIATGVLNSDKKFRWDVDEHLGKKQVYGLKFKLESKPETFQYSMPFSITPKKDAATSAQGVKTIVLSSTKMPAVPTTAATEYAAPPAVVATSPVTSSNPVTTAVGVSRQGGVDCGGKNATAIAKPTGFQTAPVPVPAPNNASAAPPAGTSSVSVQTAGAASLARAGFVSLLGGLAVAAFAL